MRFRLFFILILPYLFSSCYHKDVMNDRADDVVQAFFYSGKEGKFIITKEEIFQATSKESDGASTNISGYAEYRISSYDLATGKLVGRVDMEEGIEKAFIILGASPGKIWIYSVNSELGFHCRDPKTLEVIADEKTLESKAPFNSFIFARPEWVKLGQFYGMNQENGFVMLTDMQGFHYYFDPAKNTMEKTEDEIRNFPADANYLNSSAYFSDGMFVSLSNDIRKKLMVKNEDSTAKFTYLDAALVIDNDPVHDAQRKLNYIDSIKRLQKIVDDTLHSIYDRYPELKNDVMMFNAKSVQESETRNKVRDLQRATDDYGREIRKIQKDKRYMVDYPALSDGNKNFFVIYASDVSDTARIFIAKEKLENNSISEIWKVKLKDFYRDPEKANSKGAFANVFNDGDPQFHYQWFDTGDGKIVIISQLQMICINSSNGKIIWEKPL
ncbi:MAG: hypothetical protein HY064_08880 [Bacteroidetes bacterium]|nr:hypothetical protein [Bacteroidota bacterium]